VNGDLIGVGPLVATCDAFLKVPTSSFFLCVHGNHRVARSSERFNLSIEIAELSIPIGMLRPFPSLHVGLQAVPHVLQQRPTVTLLIGYPQRLNSSAMVRVDLLVHFKRLM